MRENNTGNLCFAFLFLLIFSHSFFRSPTVCLNYLFTPVQRESPPENTANIAYEFLPSLPYVLYLSMNTYAAKFECSAVQKQDQFVFSIHQKCIAVSHAPSYLKNTLFIIDKATFWFVLRKMVYH